jgi:diacylglycerol kinase (ATP)
VRDLLFIVNAASGGRRGSALLAHLRESVGEGRALPFVPAELDTTLARCRAEGLAAIACGGDGTAAAVLDAAWRAGGAVPVGVVPLGTGNDLARSLGWSASGAPPLERLRAAGERRLDRWLLRGPLSRPWFNYISFGYDARVVRRFHAMRAHHPGLFLGAALNKALYGMSSLAERVSPLSGGLELLGPPALAVPAWAAGVVLANIASYAGGTRLGPAIAPDDGRVDAFALPAGLSLGLALGGVRVARRLGAHRDLRLRLSRPLALQVDGEPLLAPAGRYEVAHEGTVPVLIPP